MAKALLGHVGVGTDLRLAAEVRRLRGRVAELEAELARVREAHEQVLASVAPGEWVEEDLRLLTLPSEEPAYT
ncbi:MAG TPA: hypothetical protein VNU66_03090 [Mycobacteriales bacterium]|nr:hypothetical protein [Mycobacteriales bacterium]